MSMVEGAVARLLSFTRSLSEKRLLFLLEGREEGRKGGREGG